jgi:hypothetical protein
MKNIINYLTRKKEIPKSSPTNPPTPSDAGKTSDDLLTELSYFGNPKLIKMSTGGWWCFIDSSSEPAGTKLSIGSEIHHAHPIDAIVECLQRVHARHQAKSSN